MQMVIKEKQDKEKRNQDKPTPWLFISILALISLYPF